MINFDNLSKYVGRITDMKCPECGAFIVQDTEKTQWCSECTWSNDELLSEIIEILKDNEHD